jgi:hypothetical protein
MISSDTDGATPSAPTASATPTTPTTVAMPPTLTTVAMPPTLTTSPSNVEPNHHQSSLIKFLKLMEYTGFLPVRDNYYKTFFVVTDAPAE